MPCHYRYAVYVMAVYGNVVEVGLLVRMVDTYLVVDCNIHTGTLAVVPVVHRHDTPRWDVRHRRLEVVRMIEEVVVDAVVVVLASTLVDVSVVVDRDDVVNMDHWDGTIQE